MSKTTVNTRTIDHIVHLTPPGTVDEVSEEFRKLGFTVLRGGTHADGLTANALVVLKEGTYIELISFTHPVSHYPPGSAERKAREAHRWAKESPGWIDYAFLGNGESEIGRRVSDAVNKRWAESVGSGSEGRDGGLEARDEDREREGGKEALYLEETKGGRVRPDGQILRWLITAPARNDVLGLLPFFCGDVTPRNLRVQTDPPSNTEHPATVQGLAYLRLLVSPSRFEETKKRLTAVIGTHPAFTQGAETRKAIWDLDTALPLVKHTKPQLILEVPFDEEGLSFLASRWGDGPESSQKGGRIGINEVAFYVENLGNYPEEGRTPQGRLKFVPIA